MSERLQMLLSKINEFAGHVLIVGRGDGKTLVLGTPNAGNRLSFINAQSPLEHDVHAVETEQYRAIEQDLISRFRAYADDGLGHWVHSDFGDVVKALDDYDLATGRRIHHGRFSVGQRAYAKPVGKGRIEAFIGDRAAFLSERRGQTFAVPLSLLKPLLRATA